MSYYLLIFLAGIAGSFHCIGMCGGFACVLGRNPKGYISTLLRHLLYNSGRIVSYAFMGGLAGMAGHKLFSSVQAGNELMSAGHNQMGFTHLAPLLPASLSTGQRILAVFAGLLMLIMAFQLFGYFNRLHRFTTGFGGITFVNSLTSLLNSPKRAAPLAFGVFNGFLPCPLVYAFVAQAAASSNSFSGIMTMIAFGLGTFPAMLLIGGVSQLVQPHWRKLGVRVAGSFILLFGLITLIRGLVPTLGHGIFS
ncbi:MAG: hypothetical protein MAG581_02245 [Deltaproteobacteria bacterium]|jgi:sulfite exporter TauE/SafE|nr:hypothetical protein [Deltaproteobacteria bacterium]